MYICRCDGEYLNFGTWNGSSPASRFIRAGVLGFVWKVFLDYCIDTRVRINGWKILVEGARPFECVSWVSEGITILLLHGPFTWSVWSLSCESRKGSRAVVMATTQVFQDWDSPHETLSSMTRTSTRKSTTTTTRREVRLFKRMKRGTSGGWVKAALESNVLLI